MVTALATLLAVATMLVVQQETFRRGLLDYVNQVDLERAQRLIPAFAGEYREAGGWQRLRANPMRFRGLLGHAGGDERRFDRQPPEGRPGPDRGLFPGGPHGGPPPPRPGALLAPGARDGDGPRRRYALYDAAGEPVIGPPQPWPDAVHLPIELEGRAIGSLVIQPLPRLESSWDLEFARSQLASSRLRCDGRRLAAQSRCAPALDGGDQPRTAHADCRHAGGTGCTRGWHPQVR